MATPQELMALLQRASQGDELAADELLKAYGRNMLRVVRFRLRDELRRHYDSTDFTQSVWRTLLENPIDPGKFTDAQSLCAYLAKLAERKVQGTARRENTQKRGGRLQRPLDSEAIDSTVLANRDATPSQEAVAEETWQQLVAELSPRDRRILEMRREGSTNVQIAAALDVSEATVRYVLEKAQDKAEKRE